MVVSERSCVTLLGSEKQGQRSAVVAIRRCLQRRLGKADVVVCVARRGRQRKVCVPEARRDNAGGELNFRSGSGGVVEVDRIRDQGSPV